jgi:Lrp/AsnC family transcriptional regulator, leucine-responsive regulatory protein
VSATPSPLDPTDWTIIEILQEDGRISVSELGRRVGLSQPAASERMKRLEEKGVITGYRAVVDPALTGITMAAVIRLRTTHEHIRACLKQFAGMPQVVDVMRITGEDCFFLRVVVPTPQALESIVDSLAKYGAVTTSVVLRQEPLKALKRAAVRGE